MLFYILISIVILTILLSITSVIFYIIKNDPIPWWVVPLIIFSIALIPIILVVLVYTILTVIEKRKHKKTF